MITISGDFCQFWAKKLAFFLQIQCYDPIFAQASSYLDPKRRLLRQSFWRKY
jgi:hypothetical protein